MSLSKITIAIDGFSSTGKSTMAKELAKHLGYVYVDSGAMYRAITLFAMNHRWVSTTHIDGDLILTNLDKVSIRFVYNPVKGFSDIFLNDIDVSDAIRTIEVSSCVSQVAAIPEVRAKMVAIQKEIGKNKGVVMDGRDIGTVVFPGAELKLFITCSAHTRAERRYKELIENGQQVSFEEVYDNIVSRDQLDTTRAISPLVKASDAIEIDNSNLSREEQFELILNYTKQRMGTNS